MSVCIARRGGSRSGSAVSVVSTKSKLSMTLSTRSRSAQGMSLCPSNTGARVSAAPAIASGDCCAAAGGEIRAKAARTARREDWVMEDRRSVVQGKRVEVRLGGGERGMIDKKKKKR